MSEFDDEEQEAYEAIQQTKMRHARALHNSGADGYELVLSSDPAIAHRPLNPERLSAVVARVLEGLAKGERT